MSTTPTPKVARARLAASVKHHPDRDHTAERRDLAAAKLKAYVKRIVDDAPPLTDEQRNDIAALIRGAA